MCTANCKMPIRVQPQSALSVVIYCRNVGEVTPKINYFHYLKKNASGSTYPKNNWCHCENRSARHRTIARIQSGAVFSCWPIRQWGWISMVSKYPNSTSYNFEDLVSGQGYLLYDLCTYSTTQSLKHFLKLFSIQAIQCFCFLPMSGLTNRRNLLYLVSFFIYL